MMIGTSGLTAFALGSSSRPLIPDILMSERIRISDPSAALVTLAYGCRESPGLRITAFASPQRRPRR